MGGVPVVPPAHNAADARRIGGTRRYTQLALRRFTSHAADALLHDPLGMPAAFDAMPHADALKTATDHCTRSAQARAEVCAASLGPHCVMDVSHVATFVHRFWSQLKSLPRWNKPPCPCTT